MQAAGEPGMKRRGRPRGEALSAWGQPEEWSLPREREDEGRVRWSQVPLGRDAAAKLMFEHFSGREELLLSVLARRKYLTTEQLARAFYSSYAWAAEQLSALYCKRFVARLDLPRGLRVRLLERKRHRPPHVYLLDWNGKYLLDRADPECVRGWNPRWIAQPGLMLLHQIGVNEIWSYLMRAARRTCNGAPGATRLAVAWRDELELHRAPLGKGGGTVRPDANLMLRLTAGRASIVPALAGSSAGADAIPDWREAVLDYWPTQQELVTQADDVELTYREILVEFETGANTGKQFQEAKVHSYNRLYSADGLWRPRFGRFPRVMIVTHDPVQRDALVGLWRRHYAIKPRPGSNLCPVMITALPDLERAEQHDPAGIFGACWINAMAAEGPRLVTLAAALGASGLPT